MSVLQCPEAPPAWCPLRPISASRPSESLLHGAGKENTCLDLTGPSPASKKSPAPNPAKPPTVAPNRKEIGGADDGNIDEEIQEVEKEIGRLSLRLEALRLKKAERDSRAAGRRGRTVPVNLLKHKQSSDKNQVEVPEPRKVLQESPASARFRQSGASVGPSEISAGISLQKPEIPDTTPLRPVPDRRKSSILKPIAKPSGLKHGMPGIRSKNTTCSSPAATPTSVEYQKRRASLRQSKIATAAVSLRPGKNGQEIEEAAEMQKGREQSLSSSPKSRQSSVRSPEKRKETTTVGSKRLARRENPVPKNLRPKALLQEVRKPVGREQAVPVSLRPKIHLQQEKKSTPPKKMGKNMKVRTVASRYSLITVRLGRNDQELRRRKWSLPENGKGGEEGFGVKKSRMSLPVVGHTLAMGDQGRLQWGIPNRIDEGTDSIELSPPSIVRIAESLPKIRTARCAAESPRDSGRAKRIAELIGRESHFGVVVGDEDTAPAACENMDLEEDEQ